MKDMDKILKSLMEMAMAIAKENSRVKVTIEKAVKADHVDVTVESNIPDDMDDVRSSIVIGTVVEGLIAIASNSLSSADMEDIDEVVDDFVDVTACKLRTDIAEAMRENLVARKDAEEDE